DAVNGINSQTEAINLVVDGQFHRRVDVAFLLVPAYMQALILSAISQAMDQPRVAVEVEDDRFVAGEERIKVRLRQTVRMFGAGLQFEQIDDVNETDLDVREFLAEQDGGGQRLLRGYIASGSHDEVRLATLVVARPIPDTDALRAVGDRGLHIQVLKMELLVGDNHVDVVLAAEAVIGH